MIGILAADYGSHTTTYYLLPVILQYAFRFYNGWMDEVLSCLWMWDIINCLFEKKKRKGIYIYIDKDRSLVVS